MAKRGPRPMPDVFPTEDEVALRAYELFLLERNPRKVLANYWRIAEDELLERAARRALISSPDLKPKKP
jgi:hypothetical protein